MAGALANFFKTIDAFKKPVAFTKNRKERYRTVCGGLCTILIIVLMIFYLYLLITEPFISETLTKTIVGTTVSCNTTTGTNTTTGGGTTTDPSSPTISEPVTGTIDVSDPISWIKYHKAKKEVILRRSYNNSTVHYPYQHGFQFGIAYGGTYDPTVVQIGFYAVTKTASSSGILSQLLDMNYCDVSQLPPTVQDEANAYFMGGML